MSIASLTARRFAKFTKKRKYIKVLVPSDVLETLDEQSMLGRECLQTHMLTRMTGTMHSLAREITDSADRSRTIREIMPSMTMHG